MDVAVWLTGTPIKALLLLGCLATGATASPRFDPTWSRLPSGTEIAELRTPTSRTYSDGDGTFTVDITPTGGADSADTLQPTSSGTAVQYWESHSGRYFYYWRGPGIDYGAGNECPAGHAKFNLTSMPESSAILSARFCFYQYEVNGVPLRTRCTYPYDVDPDTTGSESLFFAIRNGVPLSEARHDGIGWVTHDLSPQGLTLLEGCLQRNWAALGVRGDEGGGRAYGTEGDTLAPYLRIEYTSSGMREARGTTARRPQLVLAPNPATGTYVTARHVIMAGTRGTLTLRDVLGRAVKELLLTPTGFTRLDLQGLAPGAYVAILGTTGQSTSRKLVIASR